METNCRKYRVKAFLLLICWLSLAHGVTKSAGYKSWQLISGPKVAVMLPAIVSLNDTHNNDRLLAVESKVRDENRRRCPSISNLFYKIYDRIVEKNSLQAFIKEGPGMFLAVECGKFDRFLSLSHPGPRSEFKVILMPSHVVSSLSYDDEIAVLIAHEVSHTLFQHSFQAQLLLNTFERQGLEVNTPRVKSALKAFKKKIEEEADRNAVLLLANAGYNPELMTTALDKYVTASAGGRFLRSLGELIEDSRHGSLKTRIDRTMAISEMLNLPNTPGEESEELLNAKEEYLNSFYRVK